MLDDQEAKDKEVPRDANAAIVDANLFNVEIQEKEFIVDTSYLSSFTNLTIA
eukprot:Awhi_evm1s6646